MPQEEKIVRVKLRNSGRFINVSEEVANAIEEEDGKSAEKETKSSTDLETTMSQLDDKNKESQSLQAEIDELKGELSVFKQKLDELLSDEYVEKAAEGMMEEQGEGEEILENTPIRNEKGEEEPAEKKEEVKNSLRAFHGEKLHQRVLNAIGVNTEGMSKDALKGAFRAQAMLAKNTKGKHAVAGGNLNTSMMVKNTVGSNQAVQRTALQRLGFASK